MKTLTRLTRLTALMLAVLLSLFSLTACGDILEESLTLIYSLMGDDFVDITVTHTDPAPESPDSAAPPESEAEIDEDGVYYSRDEVALYLWTYHRLPKNYITKAEARKLGWEGGTPERYKAGAAIGGDSFGNYEGLLPENKKYKECDIDTLGEDSRGTRRLVYATDFSAIYYTGDHYDSFDLLYGGES